MAMYFVVVAGTTNVFVTGVCSISVRSVIDFQGLGWNYFQDCRCANLYYN